MVWLAHPTLKTGPFGESMLSMMPISRPAFGSTSTSAGKDATTREVSLSLVDCM